MAYLQFIVFYVGFLLALVTVFALLPLQDNILTGLTPDELRAVKDPMAPPAVNATLWENMVYYTPGSGLAMWANKMAIVTKVSSGHQFLALFLGIMTIGLIFVIIAMARGV